MIHFCDWCIVTFDAMSCNVMITIESPIHVNTGHLTSDTIQFSIISTWLYFFTSRYKWENMHGRVPNTMWFHNRDIKQDFMIGDVSGFLNSMAQDFLEWLIILFCDEGIHVDCFALLLVRHLADVSCFTGPSTVLGICTEGRGLSGIISGVWETITMTS